MTSKTTTGVTPVESVTFGYNNVDQLATRNGSTSGRSFDLNGNEVTSATSTGTARTAMAYTGSNALTSLTTGG